MEIATGVREYHLPALRRVLDDHVRSRDIWVRIQVVERPVRWKHHEVACVCVIVTVLRRRDVPPEGDP